MKEEHGIGKIFPPPLFFVALCIIGSCIQWYYPVSFQKTHRVYWVICGIIIITLSGVLAFSAWHTMRIQKTPINFKKPTALIICNGPFGFTRNPLYLSLVMLYAGVGIVTDSVWFAPLLIVLFLSLHKTILQEEKYLEHGFGNEYSDYKKSVRRWV